ncbi:MAG: hypothetical protein IPM54_31475 [Polyangiaceae bacterium]|nr:hypothetical protein [Polyangiaceae bacterium]
MRPTNRTTWMLLLGFLGLAGLQNPGCSNEVDNLARTGEDPALKGQCTPAADDGDPCTLEGCEGQPNAHVVMAGLPCGLNNDLICTATGDCGGCTTPDQCGVSTPCLPWACDLDKICRQTPSPNGQKLPTQIPNDCKEIQCDGQGGEKVVSDDNDVPFIDCQFTSCMNGSPVSTPAPQGTACTTGGGNSCDGEGTCVECNTNADCGPMGIFCDPKSNTCFRCDDSIRNGDESDIDCGGDRCPACIQGQKCNVIQDCGSNLFCADGICCNSACDAACEACDLPTSVGTCEFIPKYGEDDNYGNGMSCLGANSLACTGLGGCKGALGAQCTGPTDCASAKCSAGKVCVKNTGDPCTQASECFSNSCTNNVCD